MKFLTKDKFFYTKLFALAIPMAMQNMVNVTVSLADTIMGGLLGDVSLAAANQANKFGTIYMLILFGLGSGANVLLAQFWGKKDVDSMKSVITMMYRILLAAGSLFSIIAIFFPYQGISILATDPAVREIGSAYLRIIGFSYLISGFVTTTLITHRSVGDVKHATIIYSVSLIINFAVDCTLIFGLFGAPKLGIIGAAIGTLVGRILELAMLLFYLIKHERKIEYRLSDFLEKTEAIRNSFSNKVLPVLINEIAWGLAATVVSVLIGRISTSFISAESIASVLTQLVTVFVWGVAHASGTIIGNTIGEGKKEKAKEYGFSALVISIGVGIAASMITLLIRDPLISVFNISETSRIYAKQLINVQSVIVIGQSVTAVGLIGVLRGAGNSKFVLVVDLVFLWLFCIPVGYILGIAYGAPVFVVYAVLRFDEILKMITAIIKILKGNWIHDVTEHSAASFEMQ